MCFANGLEHKFATRVKRQKVLKGSEDGNAHENMIINSEDKPPSGKSRDCFSQKRTKYTNHSPIIIWSAFKTEYKMQRLISSKIFLLPSIRLINSIKQWVQPVL